MPGIVGIISDLSEKRRADLEKMRGQLLHDRTYRTGSLVSEEVGAAVAWAHLPGSFSDCAPIWNDSKDVCLIMVGEDFSDEASNGTWSPKYILNLYLQSGPNFFERLNGWFSGVILDCKKRTMLLFNDRFGIQRIYYHEVGEYFYFASEAKCLLSILPEVRELDPSGIAELSSVGCVMQNRTIFSGIKVLPPASRWTFPRQSSPAKETYFTSAEWEKQEPLDAESFYLQLKETFSRVLPKYLRGDQQIGMSLTGGLDGRMIMAWANYPPGQLPCYTFGGSYRDCTDVLAARKVARTAEQSHQTIPVDGEFHRQFPELAERSIYLSDGAMDVTGAVELYVNKVAREIAPVRLTGNYGSEILRSSVAFRPRPLNESLFNPEHLELSKQAASIYAQEREDNLHSFIAFKQVPWHHTSRLSVEQTQLTMRSPFLDNELVALMYRSPASLSRSPGPALRLIAEGNEAMSRIPTDRGLVFRPTVVDKLRNHFHEFTFKAEYAYDYGMPQWFARADKVFRRLHLERLFLGRHKFYHFRIWYRDMLSDYLREVLLDPVARMRPLYRKGALERIVTDHLKGVANRTVEIHQALTYELIQKELVERDWDVT